ncbi:hypothetical protein Salat_1106900 [Sesamum alatum]|uniref:Uncharacterized protein n=1 Tax=Sesamum alatum TaxID=300844 RepID=A0AAE2CSZ5_9LAMI|nr:hypothetical protein Salat_1106900 [Sesamum alatum]
MDSRNSKKQWIILSFFSHNSHTHVGLPSPGGPVDKGGSGLATNGVGRRVMGPEAEILDRFNFAQFLSLAERVMEHGDVESFALLEALHVNLFLTPRVPMETVKTQDTGWSTIPCRAILMHGPYS